MRASHVPVAGSEPKSSKVHVWASVSMRSRIP